MSRPKQFIVVRFDRTSFAWKQVVAKSATREIDVENVNDKTFYIEFATVAAFNQALDRLEGKVSWDLISCADGVQLTPDEFVAGSDLPTHPVAVYNAICDKENPLV